MEFVVSDVEDHATIAALEGPFDVIVISDTIGAVDDCQAMLSSLHPLCHAGTRLIVAYYSRMWEPILRLGEILGLKMPQLPQNWLSTEDIGNLLALSDFQVIKREWRQLLPRRLLGLGTLITTGMSRRLGSSAGPVCVTTPSRVPSRYPLRHCDRP